jgi:hypothetical protein
VSPVNRAGSPRVFLGGIGYILYGTYRMEARSLDHEEI